MNFRLALLFLPMLLAPACLARPVTFSEDVAPILYKNCTGCHHPGDIAPMSLLTYREVKPWSDAIREAVLLRKMPPWKADPHYGKWSNNSSLAAGDIATIKAWVDQGKPQGDPNLAPPPPVYSTAWKIGQPDAVFAIPEHDLSASGPDEYEYFTVHTNFTEDHWIAAAELRPGNRKVVHHAHVSVKTSAVQAPAAPTPESAYAKWLMIREGKLAWMRPEAPVIDDGCVVDDNGSMPGQKPREDKWDGNGMLSSYLPGRAPDVYPEGTARKIPAGADLVFQIHYSRATGKPETDATSVGLLFAKQPPRQVARRMDISNLFFRLPAGDPNVEVSECHTFQRDLYLTSLTPHMHLRGKDSRFELTYPDGRKEILLAVPRYEFHWQITYRLAEPKFVPKGSRIAVISHFDNSRNNAANPDPSKVIRWGEASEMEMMDGWIEFVENPVN